MAEEYFDVVNERDEPIGRATRREVHARELLHRSVHVLVFDSCGRVFLQKRSMAKDMDPGLWDSSCSGHVDAGEDYDTAVVRELDEELGIHLKGAPERWLQLKAQDQTGWEFCWIYRLQHNGPFELHPEEIETGEWLTAGELKMRMAARPQDYSDLFTLIWSLVDQDVGRGR